MTELLQFAFKRSQSIHQSYILCLYYSSWWPQDWRVLWTTWRHSLKHQVKLVFGDLNAKVGAVSSHKEVMGNNGLGSQNERGMCLVEFCCSNHLVITNIIFTHHPGHLCRWRSPYGMTKNQIDCVMIQQICRSSVQWTKTFPNADCGSDY